MKLVHCTPQRHAAAILDIFNDAIVHSTALYGYLPRPPQSMTAWFAAKAAGDFPVLGLEDEAGTLAGFASYGTFRAYPAYKYSVEHSVYVQREFRGRGLGRVLLSALIDAAQAQDRHALIGAIDADNAASLALHAQLGFARVGLLPQVGFKFGRWLDLVLMQRLLAGPAQPVDG